MCEMGVEWGMPKSNNSKPALCGRPVLPLDAKYRFTCVPSGLLRRRTEELWFYSANGM